MFYILFFILKNSCFAETFFLVKDNNDESILHVRMKIIFDYFLTTSLNIYFIYYIYFFFHYKIFFLKLKSFVKKVNKPYEIKRKKPLNK